LPRSPLKRSTDSTFSRQVVSSGAAAMAEAVTEGNRTTCSITAATLCSPWGSSCRFKYCWPSSQSSCGSSKKNQLCGGR
jgi:hypothetical protein